MGVKILLAVLCSFQILSGSVFAGMILPIESDVVVQMSQGKVRGRIERTSHRHFYSFKRIPFAKPPIGDLRFKPPVPPEPWSEILDARKESPLCIQKNYLIYQVPPVEGQEDCLYLNVYTPKLPKKEVRKVKQLLPVMVFVHYGGFFGGGATYDYLGPEYLMDGNVVLVTFNYRLGAFGFLSTNDDEAPGNWAFKDQVAALKWVRENIGSFGGDRRRVTLFGQSAGAGSVHHHILSPASKGLFHGAITQSGAALSLWAKPSGVIQSLVAQQQALFVGCDPTANSSVMVECLRSIDADVLANSSDLFKYFSSEPFLVYGPSLEKRTLQNPQPFITEDPVNIIKNKKFHNVPWISGVVKDEGILRTSPLIRQQHTLKELNDNFNVYCPTIFALRFSVPESQVETVWKNISDFYLNSDTIDIEKPQTIQGFTDLFSDRSFLYGGYQSVLLHIKYGHNPVWFYHFGYRGNYSYGDHFAATNETVPFDWGVSHCDDLLYLFTSSRFFPPLSCKNDIHMKRIMVKLWTNFAHHKNPTPPNESLLINWKPLPVFEEPSLVKNEDLNYLNITGSCLNENHLPELNNEKGFYVERMRYWQSLPLAEHIEGIE